MKILAVIFNILTLSRRFTTKKSCPYCGEQFSVDRIPRNSLIKNALFFVPNRLYRCNACRKAYIKIGEK